MGAAVGTVAKAIVEPSSTPASSEWSCYVQKGPAIASNRIPSRSSPHRVEIDKAKQRRPAITSHTHRGPPPRGQSRRSMPVEPRRRRPPPPQSPARIEPDAYVDPEGWVQEYDQATESHYYWHVSTGATQWEPPVTGYWNQARTHKVPVRASDANLSSISSTDSTMSPTEEAQLRETYSEVYLPTDYFCPITMEVMQEPVCTPSPLSLSYAAVLFLALGSWLLALGS